MGRSPDAGPRAARTVAAMPTSDLHHEVRGSGPPVLFISGASGDAEPLRPHR